MGEPNLFGVETKAKQKLAAQSDGAVHRLIALVCQHHEKRYGEKPLITKKDGALLKKLTGQFGEPLVTDRLKSYYAWDDAFVCESGHSIGVFFSTWNRLTALVRRTHVRTTTPSVDKTQEYLRSIRAFGRKK